MIPHNYYKQLEVPENVFYKFYQLMILSILSIDANIQIIGA